jgi:Leucine-rich repeat (LRR) protein
LALQWLIDYDTDLNLLPNTPTNRFRLQQRYALAILQVQRDDAHPFFGSVDTECGWDGVTCKNVSLGNELGIKLAVTEIYIDTFNNGNEWTGQLSADLGLLSTLLKFRMAGSISGGAIDRGGLSGTLPSQIGQWINLQDLDVSNNALNGSLPIQIWQLTNLLTFDASYNYLTGSLHSEIGQLTLLQSFTVWHNDLTGSLPSQVGQLTNLTMFDVSENNFSGPVPDSICPPHLTVLEADCEVTCSCCTRCR